MRRYRYRCRRRRNSSAGFVADDSPGVVIQGRCRRRRSSSVGFAWSRKRGIIYPARAGQRKRPGDSPGDPPPPVSRRGECEQAVSHGRQPAPRRGSNGAPRKVPMVKTSARGSNRSRSSSVRPDQARLQARPDQAEPSQPRPNARARVDHRTPPGTCLTYIYVPRAGPGRHFTGRSAAIPSQPRPNAGARGSPDAPGNLPHIYICPKGRSRATFHRAQRSRRDGADVNASLNTTAAGTGFACGGHRAGRLVKRETECETGHEADTALAVA